MHGQVLIIAIEGIVILITLSVIAFLNSHKSELSDTISKLHDNLNLTKQQNAEFLNEKKHEEISKSFYQTIFRNVQDMVFVYKVQEDGLPGLIIEANNLICEKLNYPLERLYQMTPMDLDPDETTSVLSGLSRSDVIMMSDSYITEHNKQLANRAAKNMTKKLVEENVLNYETAFQDKDGSKIPVKVTAQKITTSDNTILVLCQAKDITEEVLAQHALDESKLLFREFFNHSPIGIAIYDSQKKLVDVNLSCLRVLGIPDANEFKNFNPFDNAFIDQETKNKLDKGESASYEATINFTDIKLAGTFVTSKSGHAYLDIQINNMGTDQEFKTRGYFALIQDVTERRKIENKLRLSAEQLRQSEKMEAIGSMAGGIAHDFNNMLTPIIGYAQMITRQTEKESQLFKFSEAILKAANRAKELVMQILTFSRKSDPEETSTPTIHIIPIIKEVLKLQETSLPENIKINRIIKTENDTVDANPTKLHQILMNLCTNAGHSMRSHGGILELRLTDFLITEKRKNDSKKLPPGRYLRITVKDTGTGMDKATMERIFEPFFTTKKSGEGTGMGLSVVHGIVRNYKGTITVESEVGSGSVFNVILPLVVKEFDEDEPTETMEITRGHEKILVVDDDKDVSEMTADMLASLGYETATVNFANGAQKLVTLDPQHFDLIIADQVMPGMNGLELAIELKKIRPNLPIILYSGYKESVSKEELAGAGVKSFVTKPIVMEDLADAVRNALDDSPA